MQHREGAVTPTAARNLAVSAKDQLEREVEHSENALVAGGYTAAAQQAEALLRKTLYVLDSKPLQARASFVLLQAKYELDRYRHLLPALACKAPTGMLRILRPTPFAIHPDWKMPLSFSSSILASSQRWSLRCCSSGKNTLLAYPTPTSNLQALSLSFVTAGLHLRLTQMHLK